MSACCSPNDVFTQSCVYLYLKLHRINIKYRNSTWMTILSYHLNNNITMFALITLFLMHSISV